MKSHWSVRKEAEANGWDRTGGEKKNESKGKTSNRGWEGRESKGGYARDLHENHFIRNIWRIALLFSESLFEEDRAKTPRKKVKEEEKKRQGVDSQTFHLGS